MPYPREGKGEPTTFERRRSCPLFGDSRVMTSIRCQPYGLQQLCRGEDLNPRSWVDKERERERKVEEMMTTYHINDIPREAIIEP